jgi:ubiquinone/menaquinone biosynthesis C-methylase UbiE
MEKQKNSQPQAHTKTFLEPDKIFDQIPLDRGLKVADFGCGAGHFTLEAARRVGETGQVFCLDILPQALESVESVSSLELLDNIETKRVNLEAKNGSGLEDGSVDVVVMKDMLFMNEDKKTIIEEAYRVLVSRGMLLIVEWGENIETIGPEKERRIKKEDIVRLVQEIGFDDIKSLSVGDYHYGFLAYKK